MSNTRTIRPERSFEVYSRGLPLVQAIKAMWEAHERLSYADPTRNAQINANIERVMADFDLTLDEWHYWADIALTVDSEATPSVNLDKLGIEETPK